MKKKIVSALAIVMCACMLGACGDQEAQVEYVQPEIEKIPVQEEVVEEAEEAIEEEARRVEEERIAKEQKLEMLKDLRNFK